LSLGLSIPEWTPEIAETAVTAIVSAQVSTNLGPSQCAFLAKRLDEVDLSVRTSNCLNTLNINYFGELVQYSPAELMRIYAFGKKSLEELTALLAQVNLSLDLHIPDWTPDFVSPIAIERTRDTTVEKAAKDWLTPTQKYFLAQNPSRFHLSKRVAKMVHTRDITRVGDLAILSADQAKAVVGPDQGALRELSTGIPQMTPELR
jgi:hypothetical protein